MHAPIFHKTFGSSDLTQLVIYLGARVRFSIPLWQYELEAIAEHDPFLAAVLNSLSLKSSSTFSSIIYAGLEIYFLLIGIIKDAEDSLVVISFLCLCLWNVLSSSW